MMNNEKRLLALVLCIVMLMTAVPTAIRAEGAGSIVKSLEKAAPGDVITFGDYHGALEWLVLDTREEDKHAGIGAGVLVISRQGIECRPYNETSRAVTWETCSLRWWLNSVFIAKAFSKEERALLCSTRVINSKVTKNGSDGEDTVDLVYILNMEESDKYFANDEARKATASTHAVEQGAKTLKNGECGWWLRSRGDIRNKAAYVSANGSRGYNYVSNEICCVRPVMWLSLDVPETSGDRDPIPCYSGKSGDTTWWLVNDVLYIEGAGRMEDYTLVEALNEYGYTTCTSTAPWFENINPSDVFGLAISNDVTYIGDYAFCGFNSSYSYLTFHLPDKLTAVGDYSFFSAGHIYNLTLPKGVTSVGEFAFADTVDGRIRVPAATVEIGKGAFSGGEWRTGVDVDFGNKTYCSVDGVLFSKDMTILYCYPEITEREMSEDWDYSQETVYVVPESVTEIAPYAFCKSYIEGPDQVILPQNLVSIGEYAFSGELGGCCSIRSIAIPDGVTEIKAYTFADSQIREIRLPAGLKEIKEFAFCGSCLETVYFAGTEEQWAQIEIGENNEEILAAEVHFNAA